MVSVICKRARELFTLLLDLSNWSHFSLCPLGEMMFSLLWYYRPEHTEQGRTQYDSEDEVFASRHRDANSVACIEDKCYVLTFNEYCR